MPTIKCGKCKSYHSSIAEVKACCQPNLEGHLDRSIPAPYEPLEPTERQLSFINRLRSERKLDGAPAHVRDGKPTDRNDAGSIIRQLMDCPFYGGFEAMVPLPRKGRYTVVWPNGSWRTFRFWEAKWRDSGKPYTAIGYLAGPDNTTNYVKCGDAALGSQQVRIWRKFHADSMIREGLEFLLAHGVENLLKAGEMYAIKSERCSRCNHPLTVPASVHRGLGPDCAELLGVA
jgi:hypothetical protein